VLLDSLPDAVIVLSKQKSTTGTPTGDPEIQVVEHDKPFDEKNDVQNYQMHYCNKQADLLFDTNLNKVSEAYLN